MVLPTRKRCCILLLYGLLLFIVLAIPLCVFYYAPPTKDYWTMVSSMGTLIQAMGVILGVIIFVVQNKQKNQELGYTTYLHTSREYLELQKLLMDKKDALGKLYMETFSAYPPEAQMEERIQHHFLEILTTIFEQVYWCHRKGWLEASEWDSWCVWMSAWLKSAKFSGYLNHCKDDYSTDFLGFLTALPQSMTKIEEDINKRRKKLRSGLS